VIMETIRPVPQIRKNTVESRVLRTMSPTMGTRKRPPRGSIKENTDEMNSTVTNIKMMVRHHPKSKQISSTAAAANLRSD